jgi:hypothetical protein
MCILDLSAPVTVLSLPAYRSSALSSRSDAVGLPASTLQGMARAEPDNLAEALLAGNY